MQTSAPLDPVTLLREIRTNVGDIDTPGLLDEEIHAFLKTDPSLSMAIEEAHHRYQQMVQEYPDLYLGSNEKSLITELQDGFVNFYNPATVNPYCLLYTSPGPRDRTRSRMPSSA